MIDIEKAKEQYKKHIENIDTSDSRKERKIGHMYRVADISREIAERMNLNEEQIRIAELIGLLHDIGRFEQYMIFDKTTPSVTMDINKIFDHGKAGVDILKKDEYIRNFVQDDRYDEIIYKAIYEHNKFKISEGLTKEEELFCKLIRDADKIDILYESIYIFWKDEKIVKELENDKLPKKLIEDFFNEKLINSEDCREYSIDSFLRTIAFIYDINYKESLEIIHEKDYISRIIDRFDFKDIETKEEMVKIKDKTNKYIEKMLK